MGSRKRAKPNPAPQPLINNSTADPILPPLGDSSTPGRPIAASNGEAPLVGQASASAGGNVNAPASTRNWYGGTWPRISKSVPVTQVAHETASTTSSVDGIGGSGPDVGSTERTAAPKVGQELRKSPSLYLPHSIQSSPRSLPAAAATTKLNITSNGLLDARTPEEGVYIAESHIKPKEEEPVGDPAISNKPEGQEQGPPAAAPDREVVPQSSWLSWFSRTTPTELGIEVRQPGQEPLSTEGLKIGAPEPVETGSSSSTPRQPLDQFREANKSLDSTPSTQYGRSWLGFWAGIAPTQNQNEHTVSSETPEVARNELELPLNSALNVAYGGLAQDPVDTLMTEAPPETSTVKTRPASGGLSGWAFWPRGRAKPAADHQAGGGSVGELAVPNTPSQSSAISETTKLGKRGRPKSLDTSDESVSGKPEAGPSITQAPTQDPALLRIKPVEKTTKQKALPANLLLPSFNNTYHQQESLSILQQLANLLLQGKQIPTKHVHIVRDPPHVRKAIGIGIHGYFPAPLIRTVLGQPTGTSIRFANSAAAAIKKWTESRGYECDIEKIALEGEGKIGERVDTLWKLVLNWIDKIQKADFILVACHSQGVPVAIMLVSKLIEFGCLNAARVGICAMAGVNLGPFPDYKSRLFNGSAGELFEFSNPESIVSKKYEDAMGVALRHGVRILLVGSIDDQLVSLESSTFSTISHPHIYRAVFVDGRVHAPDFITHLVGFALKLRNLGISDHGLIRELSSPLAGSLYSGEGHSRLYDDEIVYDLAVKHSLESSSVGDIPPQVSRYEVPTNSNPFILPWSMRGLLEEEYVRTELYTETTQLLEQFDNWKPTSKVLKDVKFRLEAVKSKL
ncbi:MAG: hypothetical protein M1840_005066 [Geoglossum simile]|nr:MAG: hypothetical protein M1840_005066 [Geoglossum simile]